MFRGSLHLLNANSIGVSRTPSTSLTSTTDTLNQNKSDKTDPSKLVATIKDIQVSIPETKNLENKKDVLQRADQDRPSRTLSLPIPRKDSDERKNQRAWSVPSSLPSRDPREKKAELPAQFVICHKRRQIDAARVSEDNKNKPFFITGTLKKNDAPHYSGKRISGMGAHSKVSKKHPSIEKTYYVMPHPWTEYPMMEVLNVIGFNTPKCRFIESALGSHKTFKKNYLIATKEVRGHIPIRALKNKKDMPTKESDHWKKIAQQTKKYELNIEKQVVEQRDSNDRLIGEYKISGNLFCSDIAAKLTGDTDFQPYGDNIILVRKGNRFVTYLIDKEIFPASLGKTHKELTETLIKVQTDKKPILNDPLFYYPDREQQLAIIDALDLSLQLAPREQQLAIGDALNLSPQKATGNGLSPLASIFLNTRVAETFKKLVDLEGEENKDGLIHLEYPCTLFKKTARTFVSDYTQLPDSKDKKIQDNEHNESRTLEELKTVENTTLASFRAREKVRIKIAEKMLKKLSLPQAFLPTIVEDLRGPHYKTYFSDVTSSEYKMNDEGLHALERNLRHELLYDISGLQAILNEHLLSYAGNDQRQVTIDSLKKLFKDLTKEREEKKALPDRSDIAIALGALLIERDRVQADHESSFSLKFWKKTSELAGIIDFVISEFCELTLDEREQCKAAYQQYEKLKPEPVKEADEIAKAVIAVGAYGFD